MSALETPDVDVAPETFIPTAFGPTDAREVRRSTNGMRTTDYFALLGAAVSATALTAWLEEQVQVIQGPVAFLLLGFVLFMALYGAVLRFDVDDMAVRDRVISVLVQGLAFLFLSVLGIVVIFTFSRGLPTLFHANFFTKDMSLTGPLDPLSSGGIIHAIAGTLIMISIALTISVPLGVITAVFLAEFPGRFARIVRTVVEAMTALPSIVAGLFIYATLILTLGFPRSGFAAACAMTVMMLPIIVRSADVVLRLVPSSLKEASFALGAGRWRTIIGVTLPTARSGLTTAIILGTARGIGETSPVLLTAGATTFLNLNPFSGAMISLPLATFNFVRSPEPNDIARGFGSAAVLMILVLVLFVIARLIGGRGAGILSRRQRDRRTAQSRRDHYRFTALELARAVPPTGEPVDGLPAPTNPIPAPQAPAAPKDPS